jgi:hypothetical protein
MRPRDLLKRLEDTPFQPFRVHLDDGRSIDVREPGMVIVGRSTAVVPTDITTDEDGTTVRDWSTVAISHIVRFTDLHPRRNGRPRRKR